MKPRGANRWGAQGCSSLDKENMRYREEQGRAVSTYRLGENFVRGPFRRRKFPGGLPPLEIPKLELPHVQANAAFRVIISWNPNYCWS